MSPPRIVALEGVHASGKSTHVDHVALALRKAGVYALPWHHPKPPEQCRTPYSRALWYALARATFLETTVPMHVSHDLPATVWIVDRWSWSTAVEGACSPEFPFTEAARHMLDAEGEALPQGALTILLTAPMAEIERRLTARGESTAGMREVHGEYLRLAEHHGWPAVATTLPREQVTERLVGIVRGWL
jgi:thymidylate kinase